MQVAQIVLNMVLCFLMSLALIEMFRGRGKEDLYQVCRNDDEFFGQVRWTNDDIRCALEDHGFLPTEENVSIIRRECDHHFFTDNMIETGWSCINCYICEKEHLLETENDSEPV